MRFLDELHALLQTVQEFFEHHALPAALHQNLSFLEKQIKCDGFFFKKSANAAYGNDFVYEHENLDEVYFLEKYGRA